MIQKKKEEQGTGAERRDSVWICAGAIVACLIGSGYATGQEILQFFVAYGRWSFPGVLLSLSGLVLVVRRVLTDAWERKMERASEVLRYYCGPLIGRGLGLLMPAVLFATLVVMVSGAGTAMKEYYGWHPIVGRLLLMVPIYLTVVMGLDSLVEIIGRLGPFTILFTVLICGYSAATAPGSFREALLYMEETDFLRASGSWWWSALLYTSFNLFMSLAFFAGMGAHAASRREASFGSILGAGAYGAAAFLMNSALLLHGKAIADCSIPMLYLADRMHPFLGYLFSLILISEIYTTAVPAVWALARMCRREGEPGYGRAVLGLLAAGVAGSLFPFETLLGHLYPLIGYAGLLLLGGILWKMVDFKN